MPDSQTVSGSRAGLPGNPTGVRHQEDFLMTSESLTVPVKDLLPIVTLTAGFTAKRDLVPALRYVYFEGGTLRAFSGEAGSVWRSPWTTPTPFAVPGEMLAKIVQSLADQGVEEISLTRREQSLGVRAGAFKGQLPLLDETDRSAFVLRDPPDRATCTEVTPEFWAAFDQATISVGQDETKSMLRGVYWSASGNFVTTDGARITVVYPPADARVVPPDKKPLLVPDHLLARLGTRRSEVSGLALDGGSLWCLLDSGAVWGSLLEAEFPAARPVAIVKQARNGRKAGGTTVSVPSGPMLDLVLDRLLLFAEPPTCRIDGKVTADTLVLSVGGTTAQETLPAVVKGPEGGFAINGKFLKEAMGRVSSAFSTSLDNPMVPLYFLSESRQVEHVILRLID